MGLPNLLGAPPHDHPGYWDEFWFQNWVDHQEIQEKFTHADDLGNPNLNLYVIIPWVANDVNRILLQHQQMHNDMNAFVGAVSQDLTSLNFKDPESVQEWVYNHYQEHLAAHTFLDI